MNMSYDRFPSVQLMRLMKAGSEDFQKLYDKARIFTRDFARVAKMYAL